MRYFLLLAYVGGFAAIRFFLGRGNIGLFIVLTLAVFAVFFVWLFFDRQQLASPRQRLVLLGAGLIVRLAFIGLPPEQLSEDVYRYMWDGKQQAFGMNPYWVAPVHPATDPLKDDPIYRKMRHRVYKTVYPPVSQLVFAAAYKVFGSHVDLWRLLFFLFDAVLLLFLWMLSKNKMAPFFYWLCPLTVIEIYAGMHLDIIGAALLIGAVFFLIRRRMLAGFALLTLAAFTKYIPMVLFPVFLPLFISWPRKKGEFSGALKMALKICGVTLVVTAVVFGPYLSAGSGIFEQFIYYSKHWEFNGGLFQLLKRMPPGGAVAVRAVLTAGLLAVITFKKRMSIIARMKLALLTLLLLNPVLYPWYLLMFLPLAALAPRMSDCFLLAICVISYAVLLPFQAAGIWKESPLIIALQYVPYFALLGRDLLTGDYLGDDPETSGRFDNFFPVDMITDSCLPVKK